MAEFELKSIGTDDWMLIRNGLIEAEGLNRKDAHLFAASSLMLEALEELMAVIRRSVLTPILTDKAAVQEAFDQARAAIAAAKGE